MERITLRSMLPETTVFHAARILGRSERAVAQQIEAFAAEPRRGAWTPEEDDYLRRGYGALEPVLLARLMGRSLRGLQERARELRRAAAREGEPWTADETARLKAWYATRRTTDLEVCLERSAEAIDAEAVRHGLGKDKAVAAQRGERTRMPRWTPQEIRLLERLYPRTDNAEIARQLGRTVTSVASQAQRLGLEKNDKTRSRLARRSVSMRRDRQGGAGADTDGERKARAPRRERGHDA